MRSLYEYNTIIVGLSGGGGGGECTISNCFNMLFYLIHSSLVLFKQNVME